MPWPVTAAKGLASLLKRKKPKVNRRLTPEEIVAREERRALEDQAKKDRLGLLSKARADRLALEGRTKALATAENSLMRMDLPSKTKMGALDEIQALLNQVPPAAYESVPTAQIVKAVFKKMGLPLSATAGFIGGAEMEGLAREGKLPDWITKEEFRSPEGAIEEALDATGMGAGAGALLGPIAAEGFDEVLEEPGLEEGSVGDLLFFNRIFGD